MFPDPGFVYSFSFTFSDYYEQCLGVFTISQLQHHVTSEMDKMGDKIGESRGCKFNNLGNQIW